MKEMKRRKAAYYGLMTCIWDHKEGMQHHHEGLSAKGPLLSCAPCGFRLTHRRRRLLFLVFGETRRAGPISGALSRERQ